MQTNEIDTEIVGRNRSQVIANNVRHEENNRTSAKQEAINEPEPSASRLSLTDTVDTRQQNNRSSELPRTMTKTEIVMQDVRRLKSATLDRMGRMFKTRTLNEGTSSLGLDTNVTSVGNYDDKASRKAKTNSLGRMLKLTDKDSTPRKLFVSSRTGSLSRILHRHSHNKNNGVIDKPAEDMARGIFSRILSQLRGKSFY
ncbi:uncharacterized protein LOC109853491 isoform X2 [Pseudomyrmex gracilis]|uniref:uncharacterized protein LOC109853491 isoform X2 n=1 Tax=Pseudomyrmex gracilis TaxID=219809 RepID=UPI000994DC90|nr:uncharacterized protein LOC109853491 isoform X2 [Pseudomyrmex gracilis]